MQFCHFLTHFWCFSTLDILEKSPGPLRDLTESSMQNNLRFNKNLLEIISEEIKPNCETSENLTSVYHFGRFWSNSTCFGVLTFHVLENISWCSAGSHRGSAGKKSESY